jgi:hypothetical protein
MWGYDPPRFEWLLFVASVTPKDFVQNQAFPGLCLDRSGFKIRVPQCVLVAALGRPQLAL